MHEALWRVQKPVALHSLGHMVIHKNQPYFSAMFFVAILPKLSPESPVVLTICFSLLSKLLHRLLSACFAKAFQRVPKSMTSSIASAADMTGSITQLNEARILMYVFEVGLEIKEDEGKVGFVRR